MNISSKFIGLAMDLFSTFTDQGEAILSKARGSYAPYRIRNHTGSEIHVWADSDGSNETGDMATTKISNGESVDWRFDDWKTMREVKYIQLSITDALLIHYVACHNIRSGPNWHSICWQSMGPPPEHTCGPPGRICFLVATSH